MDENPYRADAGTEPAEDEPESSPIWDRFALVATAILIFFGGPLLFAIIAVVLIRAGGIADLPD